MSNYYSNQFPQNSSNHNNYPTSSSSSASNSNRYYDSPSSANKHNQVYTQEVILISRSPELIQRLQSIIHSVIQTIEDLPLHSDIKAAVLDTEYARLADISWIRKTYPTCFIAIYDPSASERPNLRTSCFDAGANMVAHDIESLMRTIEEAVIPAGSQGGSLVCPYCSLRNLSENELWYHCPAYHINWPNDIFVTNHCPICRETLNEPLQVHIHEAHAPRAQTSPSHLQSKHNSNYQVSNFPHRVMPPRVNQLYNFSLVICRHPATGKFLLCQEFANQGFWCPGGAVDAGETLTVAAKRETMEEAGVDVELKGILGIEYNPVGISRRNQNFIVRLRVIFYAEPSFTVGMNQLPKSSPDYESAGACWCSYEEIQSSVKLRGNEPQKWTKYLAEGGAIYPLGLLQEKTG